MKKIILSFATFISFFSFALGFEANIKVGYDFFRHSTGIIKDMRQEKTTTGYKEYERGFVLGIELLPLTFKDERIKFGVGVEYNLGEKNYKYYSKSINGYLPITSLYFSKYPEKIDAITIPVYATAKFTYYRPKNIDVNLYTFARFGYAFVFTKETNYGFDGIYYGLGLGLDYKYFLAEILYDGKYQNMADYGGFSSHKNIAKYMHDFHHKVGVRLGLQLGTQHFKKAKIEPKIVEKVVEKKIINNMIIKNFDISEEVFFEFNKYKLQDLKENDKNKIEKKVKELLKSGFEITEINVIGHTDSLETDEYTYKLGLNRADTIKEYLKELGIKVEIKASSKGKTKPKVHCNNIKSTSKLKKCLQPNRRVELQFIGFEIEKK